VGGEDGGRQVTFGNFFQVTFRGMALLLFLLDFGELGVCCFLDLEQTEGDALADGIFYCILRQIGENDRVDEGRLQAFQLFHAADCELGQVVEADRERELRIEFQHASLDAVHAEFLAVRLVVAALGEADIDDVLGLVDDVADGDAAVALELRMLCGIEVRDRQAHGAEALDQWMVRNVLMAVARLGANVDGAELAGSIGQGGEWQQVQGDIIFTHGFLQWLFIEHR